MNEIPTWCAPQLMPDPHKVLDQQVARLKAAEPGRRNDTLNEVAFVMGRVLAGGGITQQEVLPPLMATAEALGLERGEIERTLKSGLEAGFAKGPPFRVHAPQRESQFWTADTLAGKAVPPQEWLVHNLIPKKQVTLLGGDGGTGKSLLALQLAVAVASGGWWLQRIVHGGPAIYFGAEDDKDEMHRRVNAIANGMGIDLGTLNGLSCRSLAGEDALLALEEAGAPLQRTDLYDEVEDHIRATRPALVVIDTLADVYPANENDRAKVRQFVGMLRHWAIKHECAVILLAHPSLSGMNSGTGTSGSTGWNNSVRSRLYLERITDKGGVEGNPDARLLKTMKSNYGPIGGEIRLEWSDGLFRVTEQGIQANPLERAERVFLKLLDEITSQGRHVNAHGGTSHAALVFSGHPNAEGITKQMFSKAMEALLSRREIEVYERKRVTGLRRVVK